MRILSIDYGEKKIGLAISREGKIAEPLRVLKINSISESLEKILDVIKENNIGEIVVGNPGGENESVIKKFARGLEEKSSLGVFFQDETLTTKDAIDLSLEAGIKRKKRKDMEDAFAAAVILQEYLDGHYDAGK